MSAPSADTAASSSVFQILKPKCVAISSFALRAHIDAQVNASLASALSSLCFTLKEVTGDSKPPLSKGLGDYIFFPLTHVFPQPEKFTDRVRELSLECVKLLITFCWGAPGADFDVEMAKQLMILVTFIIGDKSSENKGASSSSSASEETKIAACACLRELFSSFRAQQKGKRAWLVDTTNITAVGHCVTTLLDEVVNSTATALQVSATETLELLVVDCLDDEDIRASFFPGTVSQVCKSLDPRTSGKRLSKSLAAGIKFLSRNVAAVLGDEKTKNLAEVEASATSGSYKDRSEFIVAQRSTSWLRATSSQVGVAVVSVLRLRTHRQVRVRRAVFELCLQLVQECFASLQGSMMSLIETMVLLAADKDEGLALDCASSLQSVSTSKEGFGDILQSSLHGWITSFPRLMTSPDDDKRTRVLQEISISFKILDKIGVASDLLQDQLARNLSDAVSGLISSTAEGRVAVASSDIVSTSLDIIPIGSETKKNQIGSFGSAILADASQAEVAKAMKALQDMLGKSSSAFPIIQRYVRDAARGDPVSQCTSLSLAMNVLRSSMEDQDDWVVDPKKASMQKQLLDELCSVALTNLLKFYDGASSSNSSSSTSAMSACVALEAVSFAAENMKTDFRIELVDALYPVVHLLGSRDASVQTHAMTCLNNIAVSCGYPSTRELLLENVDYLVNAVGLKLNVFDISPQAPTVLLMMIRLAGPTLIPYLDDIVASIFAALDSFHGYAKLTELLFAVLTGIVEESARDGRRQYLITGGPETEASKEDDDDVKRDKLPTFDGLLPELDRLNGRSQSSELPKVEETGEEDTASFPARPWGGPGKGKAKEENQDDEDETPFDEQAVIPTAPKEPATTQTYKTIQSITRLSQHYLTHPSTTLRFLILGLISTASPLLAVHKDSYLPLVNELWPVVIERLSDPSDATVIAALGAISSMCKNAKTFMSSRVNEAWPALRSTFAAAKRKLDAEAARRAQKRKRGENGDAEVIVRGSGASYTPHYRIWLGGLKLFDDVLRYTVLEDDKFDELVESVADDVFAAAGPSAPSSSAAAAATSEERKTLNSLREAISEVNPDTAWLEETQRNSLLGLPPLVRFPIPGPSFAEVVF